MLNLNLFLQTLIHTLMELTPLHFVKLRFAGFKHILVVVAVHVRFISNRDNFLDLTGWPT